MAEILAKCGAYINLLRLRQWYKNLVIFLPLFFVGGLFNVPWPHLTIIGFFSISLASSANYIVNDLVDLQKDRLHPEKKFRPLASGAVSKISAIVLAIVLYGAALALSYLLNSWFMGTVILLVLLTFTYTFFLKHLLFADILTIATLFVIRAISGAFAIQVKISPWLIFCPFFLSMFLSVGKRHSEMKLLKEKAAETRKVLQEYNLELTNALMIISTTLLITSYALYSFLSEHPNLLFTLPFALFIIFRFFYLIQQGSVIARHPEKMIQDKEIMIGMLLWLLLTAYLIYGNGVVNY